VPLREASAWFVGSEGRRSASVKVAEIREMKTPDLHSELDRIRRHSFDLRAQAVTEKLENPHQLKAVRKDIARVLTVLKERGETGIEERQYHLEAIATHRKSG
jgi:large subunit ribosomal protein L29